ncbi:MAG: hypothetical protein Q9191_007590 [Dirinaria sp. TL-2023a]
MGNRMPEDEIQQDTIAEGAGHASNAVTVAYDEVVNEEGVSSSNTALPDPSATRTSEVEDFGESADEETSEERNEDSSQAEDDRRAWIYIRDQLFADLQARAQTNLDNPALDINHPVLVLDRHIWRRTAIFLSRWWGVRVTPEEIYHRLIAFVLGQRPLPEGIFIDPETGHLTAVPPNTTTAPAQAGQQPEGKNENAESE